MSNDNELTKFEKDILAQALADYDEGISNSDLSFEDPEEYKEIEEALREIERKLL